MSATSRRAGAGDPSTIALWVGIVAVALGVGSVTAAVHLGHYLSGQDAALPANPFELVIGVARGTVAWPPAATGLLIAAGVLLILLTVAVAVIWGRRSAKSSRVDRASRYMARSQSLSALTVKGATATATRLGVTTSPGLPIAAQVPSGKLLYSSWEDVSVDIWGPRTGKTTSRAIPAILAAPGAVIATSNKRDLLDATRDLRADRGAVWVFDPQDIAGEEASWWWNPLTYVTDEVKAGQLAKIFTTSAREPGARTDAYFDNAGTSLLANLLLAAALAQLPVTDVYLWLTDPTNDKPVMILRQHGYALPAAALAGVITAPDKQRGGVYGTAQQTVSFLTNSAAARWVTGAGVPGRPQLDPGAFVASTDSLYLLSKEGEASTGPLVTALTVAVTEAAEHLAKRSAGGRLPVPLVVVLDEAANVCRWHALPDMYSHYGSRGITIMTILQSWSQGVAVWGKDGMTKLWSAANIKVYGGGVSEVDFLSHLSQLIGPFEMDTLSTSYASRSGHSRSHSSRREQILDVADLAHLPRGRAVVIASGAPAALVRAVRWMEGPHAKEIVASIRAHDPAATATLQDSREVLDGLRAQRTAHQARTEEPVSAAGDNPWIFGEPS